MAKSKTRNKRRYHNQSGGGHPASAWPKKPLALDITLGRGGMANNNPGNKMSRKIISSYHDRFFRAQQASASRRDKGVIVNSVLDHLTKEGFRFVEKVNGMWVEAPFKKARDKIIQALREGAYELRKASVACNKITSSDDPIRTRETVLSSESHPADVISVISAESLENPDTMESLDFTDHLIQDNLEFLGPLDVSDDWENIEPLSLSFGSSDESRSALEPLPLMSSLSTSSFLVNEGFVTDDTCLGILSGLLDLEL